MPEGAIWGGFFWVDNWNTLELWRTAFDSYDGQRYLDINIEAQNNEYVLNVMTRFDDPSAVWTSGDNTVKTPAPAPVDLKDINVKASLADVNALLCQLNPESGSPFNVTSIVLRNDDNDPSGIADVLAMPESVNVYNIQGIAVRLNVDISSALENLPAGVYIVNGRKYAVK